MLLKSESKCLVKAYAKSTDIKQWSIRGPKKYFLATGYDIDIEHLYPTAFKYLNRFKNRLIDRGDKGKHYYNLRPCAYYDEFENPKLIYIHTAVNHQFFYDTDGHYINNSCYMIISDSKFLFCFLNSKLFKYYKRIKFVAYGDGQESGRCKLDYNKMVTIPIKRDVDEEPFVKSYTLIKTIKDADPNVDTTALESEIDRLVYQLYGLTYDEVLIVDPETPITREEYEANYIKRK